MWLFCARPLAREHGLTPPDIVPLVTDHVFFLKPYGTLRIVTCAESVAAPGSKLADSEMSLVAASAAMPASR